MLRKSIYASILLGLVLALTRCSLTSNGYFYHFDESPLRYEIVADEHAQVYRAAYEVCRWRHRSGYLVLRQPLPHDGWRFMGKFQCSGEYDPTLAVRYDYLDTGFKFGHQPFSEIRYFRFPPRGSSEVRDRRTRTNVLTEERNLGF